MHELHIIVIDRREMYMKHCECVANAPKSRSSLGVVDLIECGVALVRNPPWRDGTMRWYGP